jgi:toxin HigB-1
VRYYEAMIRSFKCKYTEKVWNRVFVKKFPPDIQGMGKGSPLARRKLLMLNAASTLEDLKIPPSNRLEKLHGDRKGQFSIRINNQWRICFCFENGNATDVEIVDYH